MGRITSYDQDGRMMADFDKGECDYMRLNGDELAQLQDDNRKLFALLKHESVQVEKLRELVLDMWNGMCGYGHDCRSCEHYELYEGQRFVGECEYHRRMRELGIEVG